MIDILSKYAAEIKNEVQYHKGESYDDLIKIIEIITIERQKYLGGSVDTHIEIALILGCPRPKPWKTPSYYKKIREFRLRFRGISYLLNLEWDFRNSIKESLIKLSLVGVPIKEESTLSKHFTPENLERMVTTAAKYGVEAKLP